MKNVEISLMGCDDVTTFQMMVSDEELTFLEKMMKIANATSNYGCMPTMSVNELKEVKQT